MNLFQRFLECGGLPPLFKSAESVLAAESGLFRAGRYVKRWQATALQRSATAATAANSAELFRQTAEDAAVLDQVGPVLEQPATDENHQFAAIDLLDLGDPCET